VVLLAGYPRALWAMVGAAAAPAGYTITTWGAGAVLLDAQGVPSFLESLLFVTGAASALAARLTGAGAASAPAATRLDAVATCHPFSAGAAVASAAGVGEILDGPLAWGSGAVLATLAFFMLSALAVSLRSSRTGRTPAASSVHGLGDAAG
jgi:hypothetical protein